MATNPNPSPKRSLYLQDVEEVKIVFKKFDTNGDGKISATELADVMKALGSETSPDEVSRVMEEIDTDRDGFINLQEFAAFIKGGSTADGGSGGVGEIKNAFEVYDRDNNGLISPSELKVVLNVLGEKCTSMDCSNMINTVDSDGDCNVNFDEFKKMMTNRVTDGGGSQ